MTTYLEKAVAAVCEEGRYAVVTRGVTGGHWLSGADHCPRVDNPVAFDDERNNLSLYIRRHPAAKARKNSRGVRSWTLEGAIVVFGAKYGGSAGTRAKQRWYAVLMPQD